MIFSGSVAMVKRGLAKVWSKRAEVSSDKSLGVTRRSLGDTLAFRVVQMPVKELRM